MDIDGLDTSIHIEAHIMLPEVIAAFVIFPVIIFDFSDYVCDLVTHLDLT